MLLCEQLGQEPDPTKMPLELSEFPEEVQVAFFMFSLLPDHWEGMSGTYLGKYWNGIDYFFDVYDIENPRVILYLMKLYESIIVENRAKMSERKRKQSEQKSKSSGEKTYAHNIKG